MRVRKDLWLTFHLEEIGSRGQGIFKVSSSKEAGLCGFFWSGIAPDTKIPKVLEFIYQTQLE